MSRDANPVFSVIVRRFGHDFKDDIMESLGQLQKAAADQAGYLGDHNSLSKDEECYQLVNVFAFNSRKNLEAWEASDIRKRSLAELDRYPQAAAKPTQIDDFTQLLQPTSTISKIEIVVILIFWIIFLGALLGHLVDWVLPKGFPDFGRTIGLVSVNVLLISYIFLPWSSRLLGKLKARLSGRR